MEWCVPVDAEYDSSTKSIRQKISHTVILPKYQKINQSPNDDSAVNAGAVCQSLQNILVQDPWVTVPRTNRRRRQQLISYQVPEDHRGILLVESPTPTVTVWRCGEVQVPSSVPLLVTARGQRVRRACDRTIAYILSPGKREQRHCCLRTSYIFSIWRLRSMKRFL